VTKKFFSVLLCFLSLIMTVPVQAAVIINEIYPKTTDASQEWVELYNTDSQSVSLDRWKLDHTAGDAKSFIINASAIIQPHGFLTFTGSQTNINFSIDGDTVRLFDVNGAQVDNQSYPGTLGYNTSMGRNSDGSGSWAICTTATFNTNNVCPAPSPTATPIPANIPTPTLKPTAAPTPTPLLASGGATPTQQTFGSFLPSPATAQVLGAVTIPSSPTPIPTPPIDILQFKLSKSGIAYFLLGIAAAALSSILVLWLQRKKFRQ
jgi:hypothetical protein